jgi:hypothetical protein
MSDKLTFNPLNVCYVVLGFSIVALVGNIISIAPLLFLVFFDPTSSSLSVKELIVRSISIIGPIFFILWNFVHKSSFFGFICVVCGCDKDTTTESSQY